MWGLWQKTNSKWIEYRLPFLLWKIVNSFKVLWKWNKKHFQVFVWSTILTSKDGRWTGHFFTVKAFSKLRSFVSRPNASLYGISIIYAACIQSIRPNYEQRRSALQHESIFSYEKGVVMKGRYVAASIYARLLTIFMDAVGSFR